eukprot:COSAG01_NODE_6186_length_3804_cov_2.263428_7_plen_88_part_00
MGVSQIFVSQRDPQPWPASRCNPPDDDQTLVNCLSSTVRMGSNPEVWAIGDGHRQACYTGRRGLAVWMQRQAAVCCQSTVQAAQISV